MTDLGQRIHRRRKELGLTQKQLADACGIKQASVSAWERGNSSSVRPENLYLAAKRLRTTMEWLTTGREGPLAVAEAPAEYRVTPEGAPREFVLRLKTDDAGPLVPAGSALTVDPDALPRNGAYVLVCIGKRRDPVLRQWVTQSGRKYLRPLGASQPAVEYDETRMSLSGVVRRLVIDFD